MTTYIPCSPDQIPPYVRWDIPARHAGQALEIAYACAGRSASPSDDGDEYKRRTDLSVGSTARTYYRREDVPVARWTTWGRVRGLGPVRDTRAAAERDLETDRRKCQRPKHGGYSDRVLCVVDAEGYVRDPETGAYVWPHGRTHRALSLHSVQP